MWCLAAGNPWTCSSREVRGGVETVVRAHSRETAGTSVIVVTAKAKAASYTLPVRHTSRTRAADVAWTGVFAWMHERAPTPNAQAFGAI